MPIIPVAARPSVEKDEENNKDNFSEAYNLENLIKTILINIDIP